MIQDQALETGGQPGLRELRGLLKDLLGGHEAESCRMDRQTLSSRPPQVFRLRLASSGRPRAVFVKRLRPEVARRTELAVKRWLPAAGLTDCGPPLLSQVAERSGGWVWQVYEDLGPYELESEHPCPDHIRAAAGLIARMHSRFASHALLGEIRQNGGDLGIRFYESNVRDAVYALEACPAEEPHRRLRARLLQRLHRLLNELPQRARVLERRAGPETLLHGDLWLSNVFVIPTAAGLRARLIDWDRAGVGPASYDLSTFLLRFPSRHRPWILDAYREEAGRTGRRLPPARELNFLFETAEYARYANRVIWPAIALLRDGARWGWEELAEVERWFEDLQPILPEMDEPRPPIL